MTSSAQKSVRRRPGVALSDANSAAEVQRPTDSPSFKSPLLKKKNPALNNLEDTVERNNTPIKTPRTLTGWSVPAPDTPYVASGSPLASKLGTPAALQSLTGTPLKQMRYERKWPEKKWTSHFMSSLFIFTVVVGGLWYFQAHKDFIFCSENQSIFDLSQRFPRSLIPQCFPCPEHAICSRNQVTGCESAHYTLQPALIHRIIPSTYLPFPFNQKICVDASELLAREAQVLVKVTSVLNDLVVRWLGKAQCGEVTYSNDISWAWSKSNIKGPVLGMPVSIARKELRTHLSKSKKKNFNEHAFDELWTKLLESLLPSPDQNKGKRKPQKLYLILDDTHHRYRLFTSQSPPIKSFKCRIRQGTLDAAQKYSMELSILGLGLALFTVLYTRHQNKIREDMVLQRLSDDILDAVQNESEAHHQDPNRHPLPGLSVPQLRDHFLPHYSARHRALKPCDPHTGFPCEVDVNDRMRWFLDDSTRSRIWSKVYVKLISNANIKEVAMEVNGEAHGVLMHVGSRTLGVKSPRKENFVAEF